MKISSFISTATLSFLCLFCCSNLLAGGADTCMVNDECSNAIIISDVFSDSSFVCIQGCNEYAAPDPIVAGCQMGDFPTVWYEVNVDAVASILNIEVRTAEFESPSISLFKTTSGCNSLETVFLANGNLTCIIGSEGVAKAIGTEISGSTKYLIAVSSVLSIGGDFNLCVSTISKGAYCVLDRSIEVISRSNGGPLEGPFDPAEKLRICLNVNQYTAANNGCQWFQGIVPSFGNGWDPNSFNTDDQPYNAEVNSNPFGEPGSGIYGTTIWDWFDNVEYHHDNPRLNIVDFDNNGKFELCNNAYELECQSSTGLAGGCCSPCWDDNSGTVLPPGWFAYGINGSCNIPGPPISVDWGDGNTCGGGMGPWSFCFDLVTRDTPDCMGDSTKNDLLLGFYTFADGEVGAWTGSASVCAYDQPLKLSLKALCGKITRHEPEILPTLNSEDVFTYEINDREVANWEWNISPYWAMPYIVNRGENGVTLEHQVFNTTGAPVEIKIIFIGHEIGSGDLTIKQVQFVVNPWTTGTSDVFADQPLKVFPNPGKNTTFIEWPEGMTDLSYLTIYNTQGTAVKQITNISSGTRGQEIDLQQFSSGVYFVNLVTRNRIYKTKLIKY